MIKQLIEKMRNMRRVNFFRKIFDVDIHLKEVLQGSTIAVILKLMSMVLGFTFNLSLTRLLGAEGTGDYYLALTIVSIAATLGQMGLANAMLKFTAASVAQGNWDKVVGVYRKGILLASVVSLFVSFIVFVVSPWIASYIYAEPELIIILRVMTLSILPRSLLALYAGLLNGLKRIREALLVNSVITPLFSILLIILFFSSLGVLGAAISYVVAVICSLLLGLLLWKRATPETKNLAGDFNTRLLVITSLPLFWIAITNLLINQMDTILLGIWSNSSAVGIYGTAVRIATLTSFVLVALVSITAPKFAAMYAKRDFEDLEKLVRNVVKLGTFIAVFMVLPLIISPSLVLGVFGSEFIEGSNVLVILAIGQFVNVAAGPVGFLLLMTGHEKIQRNNIIFSAGVNFLFAILLMPRYDIFGMAIAKSAAIAFKNIRAIFLVRKHLSIRVWAYNRKE